MIKRYIVIRGQYEGWHEYADAPPAVAFLRHEHRHMFKWETTIEVRHDDRELEFFTVKLEIDNQLNDILNTKKHKHLGSCEMQADAILDVIRKRYGEHRFISVCVSEDGECDGITEWDPCT